MKLSTYFVVAAGGALGTLARYWVSLFLAPVSKNLPWGTIAINVLGSFVIGFFGTLTLTHGRWPLAEPTRLFVMIGVCGGFTTFSSFSLQTLDLLRTGATARALANIGVSVALCLCAVSAGHVLASHLNGGAVAVAQTITEEEA